MGEAWPESCSQGSQVPLPPPPGLHSPALNSGLPLVVMGKKIESVSSVGVAAQAPGPSSAALQVRYQEAGLEVRPLRLEVAPTRDAVGPSTAHFKWILLIFTLVSNNVVKEKQLLSVIYSTDLTSLICRICHPCLTD